LKITAVCTWGNVNTDLTQLLKLAGRGDAEAESELWPVLCDALRVMARQQLARERVDHPLQPTAMIHEVYLRLFGGDGRIEWKSRRHFFATAARIMRDILVDDARKRGRIKRGGGRRRVKAASEPAVFAPDPATTLAVHEALEKLEACEPDKAEIVMLRYYAGMTAVEVAEAMGFSVRKVQTEWRVARAWLHRELGKGDSAVRPLPHG